MCSSDLITDTSLVAYEKGIADADGNLILTGVNDWYSGDFPTEIALPSYIVGQLNADGTTGSSLGYRSEAIECADLTNFDESSPEWCLGKDLSADAAYTSEEFAGAWTALQAAGAEISPKANLEEITLPADLACE